MSFFDTRHCDVFSLSKVTATLTVDEAAAARRMPANYQIRHVQGWIPILVNCAARSHQPRKSTRRSDVCSEACAAAWSSEASRAAAGVNAASGIAFGSAGGSEHARMLHFAFPASKCQK